MAIVERKPCDDAFDRDERAFRKAREKLVGSAMTCVRQAGHDLARACGVVGDDDVSILKARLQENLRGAGNFANVLDACREFTRPRRSTFNHRNPGMVDYLVSSALSLEDACEALLAGGFSDVLMVETASVQSRSASGEVLQVLRHKV